MSTQLCSDGARSSNSSVASTVRATSLRFSAAIAPTTRARRSVFSARKVFVWPKSRM